MTSSGLYNFGVTTENLDIITEAYERTGREASTLSANDLDSARRSLSYLFSDWSNDQPNLWTLDTLYLPLTVGVASYTLTPDTIAILQAAIRYPQGGTNTDYMIGPISSSEYLAIPNKAQQQQRPTQFYFQRSTTPVVFFWPLPNNDLCTMVYSRVRAIQDPGQFTATPDAPNRWMEAMAAGVAARLAVKWAPDRVGLLERQAAAAYERAKREDRQRVPLNISPDLMGSWP